MAAGRYRDAGRALGDALAIRQAALGPDHPAGGAVFASMALDDLWQA